MGKESYEIGMLNNGMATCLMHVPKAAGLCANIEFPRAGWRYTSPTKPETAHLTEHMIFNGCEAFPSADQFLGAIALNGADYNAFTASDGMNYVLLSPKNGDLESLGNLIRGLAAPLFTEQALGPERNVVREELLMYANLDEDRLWPAISRAMGYDVHTVRSRLKTLPAITPGDLRRHYLRTHRTQGSRATISGDMSRGRGAEILKMLGAIDVPGDLPRYAGRKMIHSPRYPVLVDRHDKSNVSYLMGLCELGIPQPEDVAAAELFAVNMFRYPHSELWNEARKRGLIYGMGGALLDDYADRYCFLLWGDVSHQSAAPLFRLIRSKMIDALDVVDRTKFEKVRRFALGQMSLVQGDLEYLHGRAVEAFRNYDEVSPAAEFVEAIRGIPPDQYLESARRIFHGGIAMAGAIGRSVRQKSRLRDGLWQTQNALAEAVAA